MSPRNWILAIVTLALLAACAAPLPAAPPSPSPPPTSTQPLATITASPQPVETLTAAPTLVPQARFAVIGDYGTGDANAATVAALVLAWEPEFILTTGDNNYPDGAADTMDANVGQFYQAFIGGYAGAYGAGSEVNRFFPVLGNHDWDTPGAQPYLEYFSLPGNERYYDFVWGPVHFFMLDSDSREPDGIGRSSRQAAWLQNRLATSTAPWQVVVLHHPPYSSGLRGHNLPVQWPFEEWGVDLVLAGHEHIYERLEIDGLTYITNGLGGATRYFFGLTQPGSQLRYREAHGALFGVATPTELRLEFVDVNGVVVDTLLLTQP